MNTTTTTTMSLADVVSAIECPTYTEVGYLTLGFGQATLPDAADGAPVSVPAAVALEAIQRYQGECWAISPPSGGVRLIGDDDPVAAEAMPGWLAQRVLGAPLAQEITQRGMVLWWHPTLAGLWLGVILPDGRAAGVDAEDDVLRVGWVEDDGIATAAAFVDEAPAWACPAIERARDVLGV